MLFIVLVALVAHVVVVVVDIVVIAVFLERFAFVLIGPHKG